MRNAKSVSMERRHERSIHWKGALYALVVAVFVYAAKMFIVDNPANIFLVYTGVFFVVLGFALSIAEKSMNIPFFNAIPNWQGAGVMVNACFLVGIRTRFSICRYNWIYIGNSSCGGYTCSSENIYDKRIINVVNI
ncbi:hypothetical protein EXD82_06350 [Peptacetobacter hominis]|uniref:Uncharacterized protein n=1 Tax=Peptacetobacter hominis TaxID=2743610 RepID=A0A544QUQ2_9FIRM|nr:hypothetical protein [Peptacetobacter hominis]TQQ84422.1 hypothetical protein EXD82_06350 [Peptacetobacter hominis]